MKYINCCNSAKLVPDFALKGGVLYGVKYCCQKVRQNIHQKISVIKTKSFDNIKKNSSFWHFNSLFVLKTVKTQVLLMIAENFWRTFDILFDNHYLTPYKTPINVLLFNFHNYLLVGRNYCGGPFCVVANPGNLLCIVSFLF